MQIVSDSVLKRRFLVRLQKKYQPRGLDEPLHVSDLVFCLRESFFRRVKPAAFTVRRLQYFVDGSRRHAVLEGLLDLKREVEISKYGVVGHADMVDDELFEAIPIELKTTRAGYAVSSHWFRQLGFYACMLNVRRGKLVVQRINAKEQNPWEFYLVEWSPSEITFLDNELKWKAELLGEALVTGDPSSLPRVDSSMSWKCRGCLYSEICKRGVGCDLQDAANEIKQIYMKPVEQAETTLESIQQAFPEDLAGLLVFELTDEYALVKPRQYLGSDNFRRIASIVRDQLGGEFVSMGKVSHFRISREPAEVPETGEPSPLMFDPSDLMKHSWKGPNDLIFFAKKTSLEDLRAVIKDLQAVLEQRENRNKGEETHE